MIIDGKKIAGKIIDELKILSKPEKFLAVFFVGDNKTSLSFIRQKKKAAEELGLDFRLYQFSFEIKDGDLRDEILKISSQEICGGLIVQLPLPPRLGKYYILDAIFSKKDVDVLGEKSLGAFYVGRNPILPPAVGTVEEVLKFMNGDLRNKKVVVIGSGFLVGKPIALWLENKAAEIIIFNEFTENLRQKLKDADIVISGVGKSNLFGAENLKEGALVIDFGYSVGEDGKIRGDFDSSLADIKKINYTPTPGGTGPLLVAKLFENFYRLQNK